MSAAERPLLAAYGSPGEGGGSRGSNSPSRPHKSSTSASRAKRTLIESACQACRRRKSKCDGQRPSCSRCQSLRSDCIYEAEEGESRWSALKRRNQQLEAEREDLRDLLDWIRTSPEAEAMAIFGRIRASTTDNVFGVLHAMRNERRARSGHAGGLPFQTIEQRLPPINSILDASVTGLRVGPPALTQHNSLSSDDSQHSPMTDLGPEYHRPRPRGPPVVLEPSLQPNFALPAVPSLSSEESAGSVGFGVPLGLGGHGAVPPSLSSEDSSGSSGLVPFGPATPALQSGPHYSNGTMQRKASFPSRPTGY